MIPSPRVVNKHIYTIYSTYDIGESGVRSPESGVWDVETQTHLRSNAPGGDPISLSLVALTFSA